MLWEWCQQPRTDCWRCSQLWDLSGEVQRCQGGNAGSVKSTHGIQRTASIRQLQESSESGNSQQIKTAISKDVHPEQGSKATQGASFPKKTGTAQSGIQWGLRFFVSLLKALINGAFLEMLKKKFIKFLISQTKNREWYKKHLYLASLLDLGSGWITVLILFSLERW
jgi:hypothetical protein